MTRTSEGTEEGYEEGIAGASKDLEDAAAASGSSGQTSDSEALSKASTMLCKMVGVQNWMELGETAKALMAICGMARMSDFQNAQSICGVANVYTAMETGSAQATLAAITSMINSAGYGGFNVDINALQQGLQSGDPIATIQALAASARAAGNADLANYLSNAAAMGYGAQNGDMSALLASVASTVGVNSELGQAMAALQGMDAAMKSGDYNAALGAISQLAGAMGFEGLAQYGATVTTIQSALDTILNLDDAMNACKGDVEWDWICTAKPIGEMVCGEALGTCTFDYALPAFEAELLCNELISEMGFQIDCTCVYKCAEAPYFAVDTASFGMNLKYLGMVLDSSNLEAAFSAFNMDNLGVPGGYMEYCKFDP
jgi:hypothetical protein